MVGQIVVSERNDDCVAVEFGPATSSARSLNIAPAAAWSRLQIEENEPRAERASGAERRVSDSSNVVGNGLAVFPADVVVRRAMAWNSVAVEVIQSITNSGLEFSFRAPCHLLLVYQEGLRDRGETSVAELASSTRRSLKNRLSFIPAGQEFREWQQPRVRCRVICFYLDPAKLPIDSNIRNQNLQPRLFFEDRAILENAIKLATLIDDGSKDARYCEALSVIIAREVARRAARYMETPPGGLALWQQRLATNCIEEHLAEEISIGALATLVRLSASHFCRAFKQSFGVPPHRYHINCRIERARALLRDSGRSVTEIAFTVGFGDASAFSAAFRKSTGETPTAYRRNLE